MESERFHYHLQKSPKEVESMYYSITKPVGTLRAHRGAMCILCVGLTNHTARIHTICTILKRKQVIKHIIAWIYWLSFHTGTLWGTRLCAPLGKHCAKDDWKGTHSRAGCNDAYWESKSMAYIHIRTIIHVYIWTERTACGVSCLHTYIYMYMYYIV